ncbi:MAG: hypothetical protein AB1627_16810 [Chloroflexota bacterium]
MNTRVALVLLAAAVAVGGCDARHETAAPASPAAVTWRLATILRFDARRFEAAARTEGVVVGDETAWVELEDGWMPIDSSDGSPHDGLVAARNGLVAWAAGGSVQTSSTGLSWTDAEVGPGEANVAAIVPLGDGLVMLGAGVRQRIGAWTSSDGTAWSPLPDAPLGMVAGTEVPGTGLVSVGWSATDAAAWVTADGTQWRAFPPPHAEGGSAMAGVTQGAGSVVVVGSIGGTAVTWRSDDLDTWTASALSAVNDLSIRTIGHVNGRFVIAGQQNDLPTVWLSADGRTWSATPLPVPPDTSGSAVVIREIDGRVVVFGYMTQDMGNGGDWPVAHLVWTLEQPG